MIASGTNRLIRVTFFRDAYARTLDAEEMALEQLRDLILKTDADTKESLPWLKLAQFGDKKTDNGSLRNDANVLSISGVELDYDDKKMAFDEAVGIAKATQLNAVLYTSPSYTNAGPKWRMLLPTSQELPPEERVKLVARVNGVFGGIFAPESFTLSQSYFYGSVKLNSEHRAVIVNGDMINLRDDLDAGALGKKEKTKANGKTDAHGDDRTDADSFEAHLARLGDGDGLGGFNGPLCSATSAYAARHCSGLDKDVLKALLRDAIKRAPKKPERNNIETHYLTDKYLDNLIASAARKFSGGASSEGSPSAPAFSEEDMALQFATRHEGDERYVAGWGKWLRFDGTVWKFDETREIWSLSRKLCREVAGKAHRPRDAKSIANAKTRAAVVSLAGEDRRLAATVDQWDADLWLLNTPGGVVDLRTGEMRPHNAGDFMTKITAVAPDANCPCPLWHTFVLRITDSKKELERFLARVSGYGLTGITVEHALFFFYGIGANGKSVWMSTIAGILCDYHRTAPIETFTVTNSDRHPTELAMLRGARLVTVTETEEGRRWAESRIKQMTGGDRVPARFMRQDFFEYTPQFKLMISGNHKPGLRAVNEAIRRRFNLIPFVVTIPPEERDKDLAQKLKAEWPGILAWMIEGCLEWQRIGLSPPKVVTDATEQYLNSEDTLGEWIGDCLERDANAWTSSADLFECWKRWGEAHEEWIGSQTKLSTRLGERGFQIKRGPDGDHNGFVGLGVKTPQPQGAEERMKKDKPPVTKIMCQRHETAKAILVTVVGDKSGREIWLPKSEITVTPRGDHLEITMPGWLAQKHGLDRSNDGHEQKFGPDDEIPF